MLVNVQSLSKKAADVLVKLDKLIDDNGPAITATLKNAETFSKTLADNSARSRLSSTTHRMSHAFA